MKAREHYSVVIFYITRDEYKFWGNETFKLLKCGVILDVVLVVWIDFSLSVHNITLLM